MEQNGNLLISAETFVVRWSDAVPLEQIAGQWDTALERLRAPARELATHEERCRDALLVKEVGELPGPFGGTLVEGEDDRAVGERRSVLTVVGQCLVLLAGAEIEVVTGERLGGARARGKRGERDKREQERSHDEG